MSKYTTEVRYICESFAGLKESEGANSVDAILENSWQKVFNFPFPIFNEDYRPILCKKILKHFYMDEIGEETCGLWQLRLNQKLNEIMPYYNKLYEVWEQDFDPLTDAKLTTQHILDRSGDTTTMQEMTGETKNKFSDTPQGSLKDIESDSYLTNATIINDENNSTATTNATTKDEYIETITGKSPGSSFAKLLDEYRDSLINIDMMIIDELEPLFFGLW